MALQKVLGVEKLTGKNGDVEVSTLEGKSLLVYFSAHWCPPCRQFTPVLAKFYRDQKAKREDFEIIFVSGDRTDEEFEGYYKEHPWLAFPFKEKKLREKMNKKFKVQGIPTLVVVDKEGKTVTTKGRDMVQKDPEGKKFPWIPRKVYEVLAETKVTDKDGKTLSIDDLKKTEAFALYFSAHWCPPCRAFTPRLVSTYSKMKKAGKNTEFIFVSSDREEGQFKEYYDEMPWATLPFQDARIQELKEICEVSGIPTLVTCKGEDGTIINTGARGAAADDAEGKEFPWKAVALGACNNFVPSDAVIEAVNESMCVILSTNDATNKETAKIEFKKAAEKFQSEVNEKDEDNRVNFFIVDSNDGSDLFGRVLAAVGASASAAGTALVMAINLGNDRAKSRLSGEISGDSVFAFAEKFKAEQLKDE